MNSENTIRLIQTIDLPHIGRTVPGPLNSMVSDSNGNLYYSDEMNHGVVSLNSQGQLRWHRKGRGDAPGEFNYPMGLSIGWIQQDEKYVECLGVCDAWNRRIQFLDLSGKPVATWSRAGETPFSEIVDVRFIAGDYNPSSSATPASYWLALDRGNHRLCALTKKGELLFQIGRCFPDSMERRWTVPGMFVAKDLEREGLIKDFPFYDFAYYPQRILGHSENALYIWQRGSRRIKQVLLGNLLPIRVEDGYDLEWISADESALLGWRRNDSHLLLFDNTGKLRADLKVQGMPIASASLRNEFWIREQNRIQRWHWETLEPVPSDSPAPRIRSPLLRTALFEIEETDTTKVESAVAAWTETCEKELRLACQVLELDPYKADSKQLDEASSAIRSLMQQRTAAQQALQESVYGWSLGTLLCHLIGMSDEEPQRLVAYVRNRWEPLAARILNGFIGIQSCLDSLGSRLTALLEDPACDQAKLHPWLQLAHVSEVDLRQASEWAYLWQGIVEGTTGMIPLLWLPPFAANGRKYVRPAGHALYHKGYWAYPDTAACLHEVERIPLEEKLPECPQNSKRSGVIISALSLDSQKRLLISDWVNKQVQRLQLQPGKPDLFQLSGADGGLVSLNAGFSSIGTMSLIKAAGKLEVRAARAGSCEIIRDGVETATLELRQPYCLAAGCGGVILLVARMSHLVMKIDANGVCEKQLGRCGLGTGHLYYPECAAEFEDGITAVAQNTWNRAIKLFGPNGDEIGALKLTYRAENMIVLDGRLFVADADTKVFHVYERTAG